MASLINDTEKASILATFESSFDTWSRTIIVYKVPLKVPVVAPPDNNVFGFGDAQQDITYTVAASRTGVFPAIIKDGDIEMANAQVAGQALAPEIVARILASPISLKVREDCASFINDGETERIVDITSGMTYLMNGPGCLQTFLGSKYFIYPLRRTQ